MTVGLCATFGGAEVAQALNKLVVSKGNNSVEYFFMAFAPLSPLRASHHSVHSLKSPLAGSVGNLPRLLVATNGKLAELHKARVC